MLLVIWVIRSLTPEGGGSSAGIAAPSIATAAYTEVPLTAAFAFEHSGAAACSAFFSNFCILLPYLLGWLLQDSSDSWEDKLVGSAANALLFVVFVGTLPPSFLLPVLSRPGVS